MRKFFSKLRVPTILLSTCISYSTIANEGKIIAHDSNHELNLDAIKERISSCEELCMDKEEELKMVDQLSEFELGRFLMQNQGLNGKWAAYMVEEAPKKELANDLEHWIVNDAPVVKATQERNNIFKRQIVKHTKDFSRIASAPCGTMDDMFSLNLKGTHNVRMVGYDPDEESVELAKARYQPEKYASTEFHVRDAWNLQENEKFDVMVSNGLNIYEPDDEKVIELYKQFHSALIPGGVLITSFLTPSPEITKKSTWKNYSTKDALKQKAIFKDITQAKWQVYRTEDDTRNHLEAAGFKVVEVIYDSQGMFPTVVARK